MIVNVIWAGKHLVKDRTTVRLNGVRRELEATKQALLLVNHPRPLPFMLLLLLCWYLLRFVAVLWHCVPAEDTVPVVFLDENRKKLLNCLNFKIKPTTILLNRTAVPWCKPAK